MKRNNLDNPLFIIFIFLCVLVINTIAPIYFSMITLSGIVFTAFFVCLKRKYYYSLFITVLAFLYIEINTGLKPLSLSLLSFFMFLYIIPSISRVVNYPKLNTYLYIFIFYMFSLVLWSFVADIHEVLFFTVIINIIIDFLFFGLLI